VTSAFFRSLFSRWGTLFHALPLEVAEKNGTPMAKPTPYDALRTAKRVPFRSLRLHCFCFAVASLNSLHPHEFKLSKFVRQERNIPGADILRFCASDFMPEELESRPQISREVITAQSTQIFPGLKQQCAVTRLCAFVPKEGGGAPESFMSIQFSHG
jgi:hypothetical protein